EGMLDQIRQALDSSNAGRAQSSSREGAESSSAQDLGRMLQSQAMQQARAMASRMRGLARGSASGRGRGQRGLPMPSQSPTGNLEGAPISGVGAAELSDLDPATRSIILKMQPKLREELLQGMREEGPEGYQKFIQDYFRRLSKEKSPK